jgi:hypothetical protein
MRHMLVAMIAAVAFVGAAGRVYAGATFALEVGPSIAGDTARVKKAAVVVRSKGCDVAKVTLTGTAEGFVNGRRQSVPLQLVALETPGVYAVPRIWELGRWVLALSGACAEHKTVAAAIVPLGPGGFVRDAVRYFSRAATPADVDTSLQDVTTVTE